MMLENPENPASDSRDYRWECCGADALDQLAAASSAAAAMAAEVSNPDSTQDFADSSDDPAYHQPVTRRHQPGPVLRLNVVSMIDVVFLLLLYFMLTMNFAAGAAFFTVNVPSTAQQGIQSTAADLRSPFFLPQPPMTVIVTTTGSGRWDYALRLDMPGAPALNSFDSLYHWLADQQITPDNPLGLLSSDNPIRIQPEGKTRWEHTVSALNACLRAGYTRVQFVAPPQAATQSLQRPW